MTGRFLGTIFGLLGSISWLAGTAATAQAPPSAPHNARSPKPAPRNPDGHADLNGVWSFATATPMERPKEFGTRLFLTDKEAADFSKKVVEGRDKDRRSSDPEADVSAAYNDFWWDQGTKLAQNRASLVVDPADGRIPPLTAEAQQRNVERAAYRKLHPADGPEDRNLAERCLVGFNSGPPFGPSAYNNNVHLFQTRDIVVIFTEMIHTVRIVALDGRPHVNPIIRQWSGDSRGYWQGDTLVVETTNFRPDATGSRSAKPEAFRLIEKFTRTDAETVLYEYTMNDPATWTRPWTVQVPMARTDEHMYEYACHEGNHAMENILSGTRAQETAAPVKTTKPTK
jgi:hypothetical protein